MKKRKEIARLRSLTDMVLQAQLAQLNGAIAARQKTQDQIAGLQITGPYIAGQEGIAHALAQLQYQHWAERRRCELNVVLARQTAQYLEARARAQLAFGKTQGLDMLAARVGMKKSNDLG